MAEKLVYSAGSLLFLGSYTRSPKTVCFYQGFGVLALMFLFSPSAIAQTNSIRSHQFTTPPSPIIADASDTKSSGPKFSPETQEVLQGMLKDIDHACKSDDNQRDTTRNTLDKADTELNTLVYQLAALREEDLVEKKGPIKIGPPDVMGLALDKKNQDIFYRYHSNQLLDKKFVPFTDARVGNTIQSDLARKGARENAEIEGAIHRALIDADPKTQTKDIQRAVNIVAQIKGARGEAPKSSSFLYYSNKTFIGVPTKNPFFEDMQGVREHLGEIHGFVAKKEANKKTQEVIIQSAVAGLVSGGLAVTLEGVRRTASALSQRAAATSSGSATALSQQAAETSSGSTTAVSTVAGVSLWGLFTKDVSDYLSLTLKSAVKSSASENANAIFVKANEKLSKANQDSQAAFQNAEEFFKSLNHEFPSDTDQQSVNPNALFQNPASMSFVKTADNFTDAIYQIRRVSSEVLRAPSLMEATGIKTTGTSGPATQLALMDSRTENNNLTINMRAFDIAGENMEVALKSAVEMARKKSSGQAVDKTQVESSLEGDFKTMRQSLDLSVKLLQDQRRSFNDAMSAISDACKQDQLNVYENWGKTRTILDGERSAEQVYLANAILARADCVHKRSLVRNAEMMKIAVTISQLKGNCTQLKSWEKAVRIYPKIIGRIQ